MCPRSTPVLLSWHLCRLAQQCQRATESAGVPSLSTLPLLTWLSEVRARRKARTHSCSQIPDLDSLSIRADRWEDWCGCLLPCPDEPPASLCTALTHWTTSVWQGGSIGTKGAHLLLKNMLLGKTLFWISERQRCHQKNCTEICLGEDRGAKPTPEHGHWRGQKHPIS